MEFKYSSMEFIWSHETFATLLHGLPSSCLSSLNDHIQLKTIVKDN